MAETTPPVIPKISFPVPASATGAEFSTADDLLQSLDREASGLYLVEGKGMWHGGIHITDTTMRTDGHCSTRAGLCTHPS